VVTSRFQLHHTSTGAASLPLIVVSQLEKFLRRRVLGTVHVVGRLLAHGARLRLAIRARGQVVANVVSRDEGRASLYMTVCAIGRAQLSLFRTKGFHNRPREDFLDRRKRNRLLAASGREQRFICRGRAEQGGQAVVAVLVAARALDEMLVMDSVGARDATAHVWVAIFFAFSFVCFELD
jgi:hypothetical protein